MARLWNNLGYAHQERGEFEDALKCHRKSRHYHWKGGREKDKLAEAPGPERPAAVKMQEWDEPAWNELEKRLAALRGK